MATASVDKIIVRHILQRKDTKTNWETENPVLLDGEFGVEKPSYKLKIGDGTTAWNDLNYIGTVVSEDSDNIIEYDAQGYIKVPKQIDDDQTSQETTWSSEKIDSLVTEKLIPINISSAAITLTREDHASKNKYIRCTSLTPTVITLNNSENYEEGDVFNIRAVNAIASIVGVNVTINPAAYGNNIIPVRGTVTIVMVSPTEADVFGFTEMT